MELLDLPFQSNYYKSIIKSPKKYNLKVIDRSSFSDLPLEIPSCTSLPKIPIYRSSLTDDLDSLSNNSLGSSDRSSFASSSRRSLSDRTASLIDFFVRRKKSRSGSIPSGTKAQRILKYFDEIDTTQIAYAYGIFPPSQQ
ncbi:uncharacterized protein LOC132194287 [Neocloeon triangulifer]|uniref:uncharacterized protein LOC132194287 n=1 Tax=Neocloeon triangulifer TaxID=2078957 RepID=UPI00286F6A5B|nr:uncharacterized protein LOC132194287 [Neocloeon triangulifer]